MSDDARADAELLAAASCGDGAAFGVLVRRYVRAATLLAAQILGDADDAEDIAQAAFIAVHRQASRFDAARPFGPWLFAIVRRLAANRRVRDRRRARLLQLWGGDVAAPPPSDGDALARSELAVVARKMESLPAMQRACFELVAVRALSVAEVAAMHGISESTVRQHVFRARAALRGALEQRVDE